jgi:hypothetical protein
MKTQKQLSSAAIALVLMLTIAAALMASTPTTSGQLPGEKLSTGASLAVRPNPVGINQTMQLEGVIWPVPSTGTVYSNVTLTITRPDGTKDIKKLDTDNYGTIRILDYSCNQTGTWSLNMLWLGDAGHLAPPSTTTT